MQYDIMYYTDSDAIHITFIVAHVICLIGICSTYVGRHVRSQKGDMYRQRQYNILFVL